MVAVQAAQVEAEHDLPQAVALGLGAVLELLEAGPGHELADHHPLVRQAGDHVGDVDEGVAAEDAGERALVLGLQLVVQLLVDARAHLVGDRLGVQARRHPAQQAHDQPQVGHVGAHGTGHARVLDLDRHVAAVVQLGAVDLPDRGGGDRLGVEGRELLVDRDLQLVLDHLAHVVEAHLGRGVAQLAQLALELLAVLLGHQADVQERHHLTQLHRRALHRAQRADDLLGGLDVAALQRPRASFGRAGHVGHASAGLAHGLARRQPADLAGAPDPGGGDLVLGHRRAESYGPRPLSPPAGAAPPAPGCRPAHRPPARNSPAARPPAPRAR